MGTFKIQKSASSEPDQNVEITVPEMNDTRKNFALKDQQRNGNFVCDCPYEICGQKRFYNIILYYIILYYIILDLTNYHMGLTQ